MQLISFVARNYYIILRLLSRQFFIRRSRDKNVLSDFRLNIEILSQMAYMLISQPNLWSICNHLVCIRVMFSSFLLHCGLSLTDLFAVDHRVNSRQHGGSVFYIYAYLSRSHRTHICRLLPQWSDVPNLLFDAPSTTKGENLAFSSASPTRASVLCVVPCA